jgi:hypothetical protein
MRRSTVLSIPHQLVFSVLIKILRGLKRRELVSQLSLVVDGEDPGHWNANGRISDHILKKYFVLNLQTT